jgi:hypothetical protein
MDANNLILAILNAHKTDDATPIQYETTRLEPQLDYKGKMARDAFRHNRIFVNKGRIHAGLFDFKIFIDDVGMEHEHLLTSVISELPIEVVRKVHAGDDPVEMPGLTDAQRGVACAIQAAFVEQELNWGEELFQLWTYFGNSKAKDPLLRDAAPRDFQMVYIERCASEIPRSGHNPAEVVHEVILSRYLKTTKEARNLTIMPPIENKQIVPEFREHMPPTILGRPTTKWIGSHMPTILEICEKKGPNPYRPS